MSASPRAPRAPVAGRSLLVGGLCGLGALLAATPAAAFCRTTTCVPGETCEYDPATGCALTGLPLEWKRPCVSFGVQQDASPLRGISYDEAHGIIENAYANWLASPCEGGLPSIDIADFGPIACAQPEYNQAGPNANVWMFRDDVWGEDDGRGTAASETPSGTLAITIITYNPETGEIFDADVEINSLQVPITTSDTDVQFDLASIVTHEAGHFLGLSHSRVPDSTMRERYLPGTTTLRQLSEDDHAGMCSIYPPDRELPAGNCTPRHGFSSSCYEEDTGCAVAASSAIGLGGAGRATWWGLLAGLVGLGALSRRRERARAARS